MTRAVHFIDCHAPSGDTVRETGAKEEDDEEEAKAVASTKAASRTGVSIDVSSAESLLEMGSIGLHD